MQKETIFTYIIIGFVLFICYKFYSESSYFQLKCVISDVNGKKYCLREREKIDEASDLLAKVEERCKKLNIEIDRYNIDSTKNNSNEQYIKFADFQFNV